MVDFLLLVEAVHAAGEHAEGPNFFGLAPGFFVAMAVLLVFLVMIWLKVPALVASMLDKQIAGIRQQLDDAARLRSEADALRIEYESKVRDASRDAEAMKASAEQEAKQIVAKAKSDAELLIARRTKSAEEKIAAAERSAVAELQARTVSTATSAARRMIAEGYNADADKALVEQAISAL